MIYYPYILFNKIYGGKTKMAATLKAYKGMGMEGRTARWYDRTTRKDMPEFRALAIRIAGMIPPAAEVLEVAPGPGFLSIELAKRGLSVRAVDISRTFVDLARRNAAADGVQVRFDLGNAADLPLQDGSVDFVVCRAAFKNFTEPQKALAEVRRVLRPGGRALLIDMRRDASMADLRQYAEGLGGSRLNRWFVLFVFRFMLIKRAYPVDEFRRMAVDAGWTDTQINTSTTGFEALMTTEK
jgi:ubiquinone/menaquinone biosynthesis C-methylase UbiE